MTDIQRIGVVGAGSWGSALALQCARKGFHVTLWAYEKDVVEAINATRINAWFLPGFTLPDNLEATADLEACVSSSDMVLCVAPTPHVGRVMGAAAPYLRDGVPVVSCSKGIENESLQLVSEILERVLPPRLHSQLCYLSGPSFAKEVASGMPTVVTIAAHQDKVAVAVQRAMSDIHFRCYTSPDVVGVEMGGALKNVIAIAAGCADGLGFGHNTRAALITRGLAEITRMAVRKGANPLTLLGLSGMGDLVLTCTGELSRNRTVGFRLGQGETIEQILGDMRMVAEGVLTSRSAYRLGQQLGVETPIIEQVYRVLHEGHDARDAVEGLMMRELKSEAPVAYGAA